MFRNITLCPKDLKHENALKHQKHQSRNGAHSTILPTTIAPSALCPCPFPFLCPFLEFFSMLPISSAASLPPRPSLDLSQDPHFVPPPAQWSCHCHQKAQVCECYPPELRMGNKKLNETTRVDTTPAEPSNMPSIHTVTIQDGINAWQFVSSIFLGWKTTIKPKI